MFIKGLSSEAKQTVIDYLEAHNIKFECETFMVASIEFSDMRIHCEEFCVSAYHVYRNIVLKGCKDMLTLTMSDYVTIEIY